MTRDSTTTKIKETEHQCQLTVFHGKEVQFNFCWLYKKWLILLAAWRQSLGEAPLDPTQHFWGRMNILQQLQTRYKAVWGAGWLTGTNGGGTHRSTSGGAPRGLLLDLTIFSIFLQWPGKNNYCYWQNLQVTVGQAGSWGGFDNPRQWKQLGS